MPSIYCGKPEVCEYLKGAFPRGSTCLDVGACDGEFGKMLNDHFKVDGIEIFKPYVEEYHLEDFYEKVIVEDIANYMYEWYDLVVFGDVIEHMGVKKAQYVLTYAREHSKDQVIAVPYLFIQGPLRGNEY